MSEEADYELPPPEEIQRRLLKLADSLKGPSDYTHARYKQIMQLPPQELEPGQIFKDHSDEVADTDWVQVLSFTDTPGALTKGVLYTLEDDSLDRQTFNLRPICGMGFDRFQKELLALGYTGGFSSPSLHDYEPHNGFTHSFTRNDIHVSIFTEGGGNAGQNTCMLGIWIWASNAHSDKE